MPSPFPGMDPWLENPAVWPDVHSSLIYTIRSSLAADLPPGYTAEIGTYVWLAEDGPEPHARPVRRGQPDVSVTGSGTNGGRPATAVADAPTATVRLATAGRRRRTHVRLVDQAEQRLVTVIELLSPSNKDRGPDRDAYLAKRNECRAAGTNLVEIDVLRDGDRLPMGRPRPPVTDYYVLISRAEATPEASVWAFGVRDEMPVLPVPLRAGEPFVPLRLKACLDRAYDDARYVNRINYTRPPVPPLSHADAAWAAGILSARQHSA